MRKIMRIFTRKTKATPIDENVRINCGPELWDEADEVHVSVAFTWDLSRAEFLAKQWAHVAPVKIGGPATGDRGQEFIPGMYLKPGYVITSRGCPNNCWFCDAWKREGQIIRALEVKDGFNLLDNNILACSVEHQEKVFLMLERQKERSMFTGGLEAARFTEHHAEWLQHLKPQTYAFAYDEPSDWEPLVNAARICREAGLVGPGLDHVCRAYVLVGYPKDTMQAAEERLKAVCSLYIMPEAMLYDKERHRKADDGWVHFQRTWIHPVLVGQKMREITYGKINANNKSRLLSPRADGSIETISLLQDPGMRKENSHRAPPL